MTKGEYPFSGGESKHTKVEKEIAIPSQDDLNYATLSRKYEIPDDNVFSDENHNKDKHENFANSPDKIHNEIVSLNFPHKQLTGISTFNNNGHHIDIEEFVQHIQNADVKHKLTRLLSRGLDEDEIDIENMENYLVVACATNSTTTLEHCEHKLIQNINHANCKDFYQIAHHYQLQDLQTVATIFINDKSGNFLCCNSTDNQNNNLPKQNKTNKPNNYDSFYAIFTCGKCEAMRTVRVMVYDQSLKLKECRRLQMNTKISNPFQCCCLQADADIEPYVFWCFGRSVYRYDPLLLKRKERGSLRCKRSKFSFVTLSEHCYVIGGEYQMHSVYEIEEYSCHKNKWRKVAMLPRECLPIGCSCVVFNDRIYIFTAMVDDFNEIKKHSTGVFVFHPVRKTVKKVFEIPFWFNQIKSCTLDSFIYLASDNGLFIRFNPTECSFTRCQDQILICKDFGMFSFEDSIICVGGRSAEGMYNEHFRRYSPSSDTWDILPTCLPEPLSICGVCELKIPKSAGAIIPFHDKSIFEK